MSRPRVPLTEFEREHVRMLRNAGAVFLVAGLATAGVLVVLGYSRAAAAIAAVAALFFVGALVAPLRVAWLRMLLYALMPVVVFAIFGYAVFGALLGAVFAVSLVLFAVRDLRSVPSTLRALEGPAVDPEAAVHVAAFEELGFEQAGAYAFDPVRGKTVVATLLVGPERDEYVVVTDLVLVLTSLFGARVFLTRNSASASLPPEYLSNDLRGAEPRELADAHRRGLELLAARGLVPEPIDAEQVVKIQLEVERRCSEWALLGSGGRAAKALLNSGLGEGELDESPSSVGRIDAWLASPSPAF